MNVKHLFSAKTGGYSAMSYFIFLKKHYFETKKNVGNSVLVW